MALQMDKFQHIVKRHMTKQRNMSQIKEQNKSPENDPKGTEEYELPDTEFKITLIKMVYNIFTRKQYMNKMKI